MSEELELFVACLPGLEPIVAAELRALGVAVEPRPSVGSGGVHCRGGFDVVLRTNLWLGAASHVLVRVARFRAWHFAGLRRAADAIDWRAWIGATTARTVRATSRRSKLIHTGAIAERVTLAIDAQLGGTPDADTDAVPVVVRMVDDECTISIDTSGAALHQRGWRLETAKAPLREDLAHALVLASGWDPTTPLVDPFCGSGTIPIVAACIARGVPPGDGRHFAFERLVPFDAARWDAEHARAREARRVGALPSLFGSDRNAGAIEAAARNAERAGVAGDVRWDVAPLSAAPGLACEDALGAVVTNPPFGVRVGDVAKLLPLYQSLGSRIATLPPAWRVAILAVDRRLALRTGRSLSSAFLSNHGGLRVRALVGSAAAGS